MDVSDLHSPKASVEWMEVTLAGMVTEVRALLRKAKAPMDVTPSDIVADVRLRQYSNA